MAEQAKSGSEQAEKDDQSTISTKANTKELWQRSLKDLETAAELEPDATDAIYNAQIIQDKLYEIDEQIDRQENIIKQHRQGIKALDDLIKELQELLDEENQQDQQNQDNQDQQENEQEQDQQQNQKKPQGQQGENQQDQQQDTEQSPSENQQEKQEDEDKQQQQGADDKQQERQAEQGQQSEGGKNEQGEQAQAGEQQSEQQQTVQMGVMSPEQARLLLDSMKAKEKKLPVSGYGPKNSRTDEQGNRKDW